MPVAATATSDDSRLPAGVLILGATTFAFLLATATLALVPGRALPSRLSAAVDGRDEPLLFVALCALGGFATVLLVAFVSL